MKFLKAILDFYINASIHVAFAVYALVRITEIYFDLPYQQHLNYFIFFGTITGYNFVKYAGVAKLHHRSLTDGLKVIQIFSFLAFLAMLYYAYQLPLKTLYFSIPFALLTLLYAVPFLSGFEKNLREVSHLKNVVIALVWVGFTVIIPLVHAKETIDFNISLYAIQRFLLVIVLILPFDIRDVKYDAISLQTIPQKIGVERTKRLGIGFMVIALVLEYIFATNATVKTPFMLFFFMMIIFLMRAKTNQSKYYSAFWVEALPIFWWLLLLGFHNF